MRAHRIPVVEVLLVACILFVLTRMGAVLKADSREVSLRAEARNNLSALGHYFSARAAGSEGRFAGFDYDGKRFTLGIGETKHIALGDRLE